MTRYRSCAILVVLLVACVTVRVQADPLRLIFLPPDASYSAPVPARNFRLRLNQAMKPFSVPEVEAVLLDGPADIQLRLTTREMGRTNSDVQGLSLTQLWVGTLTSDWIQFPAGCHLDR